MPIPRINPVLLSLGLAIYVVSLLPSIHSLSTVAISENGDQTLVCAVTSTQDSSNSFLDCKSFPGGIRIPLDPPLNSVSGIVGGHGFVCALVSLRSSSPSSIMVCWRFSSIGNSSMTYKRIYRGPVLTDLRAGNSAICGLINGSSSLQCWQWRDFSYSGEIFASSDLAVGDNFVCGLSNLGQIRCTGSDANLTQYVPTGNYTVLAAGFRYACAISFAGNLDCWGNMAGEKPLGEFVKLALGENRGCALRSNATVICWGENQYSMPSSLRDESFVALEAKRNIFCGVKLSNYALICWGNQDFDSRPLVFGEVVPGPCRTRNECACGPLPNYAKHCDKGLMICQPCFHNRPTTKIPPPPPLLPPTGPWPSPSTKGQNSNRVVFIVVGCVGSFSLLLTIFATLMFFRCRQSKGSSRIHDSGQLENNTPSCSGQITQNHPVLQKLPSHLIQGNHLQEFSLDSLRKLTDNFSNDYKIGTGSFGSVYHATLDDGQEVAIKRAEASAAKRDQDDKKIAFLTELELSSLLNHKNLVRLLGYCQESDELALVFEYMPKCSLFNHLHILQSPQLMSWPSRIKIALDAARGIEYLHEFATPCVIHRDIKSSNVLLDSTWTAKISDFGLSLRGAQELQLHAAGTMGYLDPQYYRLQVLTNKSDVYSFGVLLLELLSGCKAIHKNEIEIPRNVVDYVVPYIIRDEIHRVLDRRVPPPSLVEIEAVAYVGYLAADCVVEEGRDRPTMTEVVSSLNRALDACLASPKLSRSTTDSSS